MKKTLNTVTAAVLALGSDMALCADTVHGIEKYECRLTFAHDSSDFSGEELEACYTGFRKKPDYLYVFATSSPEGSGLYNLRLSERRAFEVTKKLRELFPGAGIEAHGGGINPKAGRSARIIAVVSDRQPAVREMSGSNLVIKSPEPRGYSLSALGGLYNMAGYRYNSAGAEFTRQQPWKNNLSWSYGVRAMVHANDEVLSLSSLLITPGISMDLNQVRLGMSFPAGLVLSENERRADAGIELSLGSVYQDYLSYGMAAGKSSQFDSYLSLHTGFRL